MLKQIEQFFNHINQAYMILALETVQTILALSFIFTAYSDIST